MSSSKREEFFNRGVAAYNSAIGPGEYYVCPICTRGFTRADLETRVLTLEHVPPDSAGGAAICLTCHACNSAGGHQVDYAIAELGRLRKMQSALRGEAEFEGKINLDAGGVSLNAHIRIDKSGVIIELPEGRNNPELFRAQMEHFREAHAQQKPELLFNVTAGFRMGHRALSISLLRAAYLAAFSWFGYRYALSPRLDCVREQILDPSEYRLPNSAVNFVAKDDLKDPEELIAIASVPFEAVVVYLPANAVHVAPPVSILLPWLRGPDDFYGALSASYRETDGKRRLDFQAHPLGWPSGPALTLDFL
jgi:hypothetical protein